MAMTTIQAAEKWGISDRRVRTLCANGQIDGAWREVGLLHYSDTDPVIHTGNELGGMTATKLRITNISGAEQQVFFKNFRFIRR